MRYPRRCAISPHARKRGFPRRRPINSTRRFRSKSWLRNMAITGWPPASPRCSPINRFARRRCSFRSSRGRRRHSCSPSGRATSPAIRGRSPFPAEREAEEEIGLGREFISPLGYLDPYLSGTGFRVVPVVGLVAPGFTLALNPREVTEAFEVPLDFLMSPDNHARHSREWKGAMRSYYAMPYGERYIWGVTAGIVRRLYERLYT